MCLHQLAATMNKTSLLLEFIVSLDHLLRCPTRSRIVGLPPFAAADVGPSKKKSFGLGVGE